jgi:hypothetical protein
VALLSHDELGCERQIEALVRSFEKRAVVGGDLEPLVKLRGPEACR